MWKASIPQEMKALPDLKLVLIGAGNVATQFGLALKRAGFSIVQVYSRTLPSAQVLAERLETSYCCDWDEVTDKADVFLFSLPDDVLPVAAGRIFPRKGLYVHTSGSVSFTVFEKYTSRYGVLYPLQTFSKNRDISFRNIPVFVEGNHPEEEDILLQIGRCVSESVYALSSDERKYLHLSAVFACNFTNHMYAIASRIMKSHGLPWEYCGALIDETVIKMKQMDPFEAQTGPAVRNDQNIIKKHLDLLEDPCQKAIYQLLSDHIYRTSHS